MWIVSAIIQTLFISLVEMTYLVGVLIGIGLILGVLEKYSNSFLFRAFGPRAVLLTAWIGTPVHELGHIIQCFIWGHRITRFKLLELNRPDQILGYVEHQYNQHSVYQQIGNFFIGIGPIFSGIGTLIISMYLLIPESYHVFLKQIHEHVSFETLNLHLFKMFIGIVFAVTKSFFTLENLLNPVFWLFLIIGISISSHIALSWLDIQGAARGLITIYFLLILINIAGGLFGYNSYVLIEKISEYNTYLLAFSSIAIILSLLTLIFNFLLYMFKIKIFPAK